MVKNKKMEKRIIPIALLVLALSSMLIMSNNIKSAYAIISFVDVNTTSGYDTCKIIGTGLYCVGNATNLLRIDINTNTVTATYDLKQLGFGSGLLRGIGITGQNIYTIFDSLTSPFPEQIIKFSTASNTVIGRYNYTFGTSMGNYIASTSNLVFHYTTNANVNVLNGNAFTLSSSPPTTIITTYNVANVNSGNSLFTDGTYVYVSKNAGVNNLQIWTIATSTQKCAANVGTDIQFYDYDTENNVVVGRNGNAILRFNDSCATSNSINVGATAFGLQVDTSNHYYWIGVSDSIRAYDYSNSNALVATLPLTSSATYQAVAFSNSQQKIFSPMPTSNQMRIFTLGEPEPIPNGGIDCNLPENANILTCRLGGSGTFGSAGNFIIGQAPTNTTDGTGLTGIGCAIGLVDCVSNPDIKTNGLGLLIFISSIFIVVGMFMTTQGAEKTFKIPTWVWAIIIVALSAFFTLTNIIDPVFLIISIIGLIALASPRLVSIFSGGSNTFGSGSTE